MRYLVSAVIACFIFTSIRCAQKQKSTTIIHQSNHEQNAFDIVLTNYFNSSEFGGVAMVTKEGEVMYKKAIGTANRDAGIKMSIDHKFRIASNTKQFTACAILKLQEEGKLSIADDIRKYVPEYPTHGHSITLEHLLTHTSGIRDFSSNDGFPDIEHIDYTTTEFIEYFKDLPVVGIPGEGYHYSNSGYFLLGTIIEKVSGQSYGAYLGRAIFKPLGMTDTFFDYPSKNVDKRALGYTEIAEDEFAPCKEISMSIPFSAGGIVSTVGDLHIWYEALKNLEVINTENLEKAHAPFLLNNGEYTRYGYGWDIGTLAGSPIVAHGGAIAGYYSTLVYLSNEDILAVVLTNCNWMDASFFDLGTRMASIALEKPYYEDASITKSELKEYKAAYEIAGKSKAVISLDGDNIYMTVDTGPKRLLHFMEDDTFYSEINYTTVKFMRDADGNVESLIATRAVSLTFMKNNG